MLGFLPCIFLSSGICSDVRNEKRVLLLSDVVNYRVKRTKICCANLADTLEIKLLSMDGNLDELNSKVDSCNSVSKERDDAPVPIDCWLYWLNGGLAHDTSPADRNKFVVIIQKRFQLVWSKRNLMRIFNKWLKLIIGRLNIGKMIIQNIIGLKAIGDREGKWIWCKGDLKFYKRQALLRKVLDQDIVAARDCIKRAMGSSWWYWCDGSRPFF